MQVKKEPFKSIIIFGIFLIVCFLIYGNSLKNDFVFDDRTLVVENSLIKDVGNIPQILGIFYGKLYYRPIRNLSYLIDYSFSALNPVGYHASNILYHSIVVFLVYLISMFLVGNFKIAIIAAILFAVHPVHTDAVTYISGRRDILSTLFFFLGFYYFLKLRAVFRIKYVVLIVISYFLAILSKEMAITLPLVMFLYDYYIRFKSDKALISGFSFIREVIKSIGYVLNRYKYFYIPLTLSSLYIIYHYVFVIGISHKLNWYGGSAISNFATVGKIWGYYIKLLFFPLRLNADYSYNAFPVAKSYLEGSVVLSIFVIIFIFWFSLFLLNRNKYKIYAFCILFYFLTLLPVSHIIPHHELLAEHYLYLPSFGFCLLLGLILGKDFKTKLFKNAALGILIILIMGYSTRTVIRNRDWRNEEVFWQKVTQTTPECVRAHDSLGVVYKRKGLYVKALSEYKKALEIDPRYSKVHYNLGSLYEEQGMIQKAIDEYNKAIKLNPDDFQSHNNLSGIYLRQGLYGKAINESKNALSIKPDSAKLHNNLANIYKNIGLIDEAIEEYNKAIKLDRKLLGAYINLGVLYHQIGKLDEVARIYKDILTLNPNQIVIRYNLGTIFARQGKYDLARDEWEFVLVIDPYYTPATESLRKLKQVGF